MEDFPDKRTNKRANKVHGYNKIKDEEQEKGAMKRQGRWCVYQVYMHSKEPKSEEIGRNPKPEQTWQGRGNTDSLAEYIIGLVRVRQ
jgi:hypothetical protein